MALTTSYAAEEAVYEFSYTAGTNTYVLAGAWSTHLPFSERYPSGAAGLAYYAKDGSSGVGSQFEIGIGDYDAGANTLTRSTILESSNDSAAVNWSGRTRLLIRPLIMPLPLSPTPPTDGQVLVFNTSTQVYEPADLCALVAACTSAFSVGAVSFKGQAFLWNFPAMTDSPVGSMSVWLKVQQSQLPVPGIYTPDVPDGDLTNTNLGYLIGGPPVTNFNSFFIAEGATVPYYGSDPSMRQVNPITNITSANPAVITFTHPHGIPVGTHVMPFFTNQSGWGTLTGTGGPFQYLTVTAASSTTVTIDFDSTGFPPYDATMGTMASPGPNATAILQVFNATNWEFENFPFSSGVNYRVTRPIDSGVWVNVLSSWDTNHAANSKIVNLYYNDTLVPADGSNPSGTLTNEGDIGSAFSVTFSTPSASENDSWMVGGTLSPSEYSNNTNCIVCDMAELWFAPGQYIDFSVSGNRAKFHDAMNNPISLGADGSLPTGTPPVLYQSIPGGTPPDPYVALGLPLRFVNPLFNGATLAGSFSNGITASPLLVCSFWIYGGGDQIVVSGNNNLELDVLLGTMTVDVFDASLTDEFTFTFPITGAPDVFNVCFAVDTNHGIGSKLVLAYVNNVSAPVTVVTDNAANWSIDWTGGMGFVEGQGFIADFWLAPSQYFDPKNKFMSAGGDWVDIGTDGAGANGTAPSVYLSVRGAGPASDIAVNRGTGGALTLAGPASLVPTGAPFLLNRSGNRNLLLNSGFTEFPLAPTHP